MDSSFVQDHNLNHNYSSEQVNLSYFGGILDKKYQTQLQKMVFRISKGNAYTLFREVNGELFTQMDIQYDEPQYQSKIQFMIVYQSGQHDVLRNKLQRAMDSFNIPKYLVYNKQNGLMSVSVIDHGETEGVDGES